LSALSRYKLRLERKKRRIRSIRKRRELTLLSDNTGTIGSNDILLFCTMRNEYGRLPYFLEYYRNLGIGHFLFVDNDSDDNTRDYLTAQPDVSLWTTPASYRRSRFGIDWINGLLARYGTGHWTLVVDVDEFFVFPHCDARPIRALTDWLQSSGLKSYGAMLVDMYPKGPIEEAVCAEGQNPFAVAEYFDAGNYTISRNPKYNNLWIQGGPRARAFFSENPQKAPSLNKIPLVKWRRGYVYVSSTHALLPAGLNHVYDDWEGEKSCGCLLHAKFLNSFTDKCEEELVRKQHFDGSVEYRAYAEGMKGRTVLWNKWSEKYINWRQLEILGLMSKGSWI